MPAVTADYLRLPRLTAAARPRAGVVGVTTAPTGLEAEGFPVIGPLPTCRSRTGSVPAHGSNGRGPRPGEPKGTPWHPHPDSKRSPT